MVRLCLLQLGTFVNLAKEKDQTHHCQPKSKDFDKAQKKDETKNAWQSKVTGIVENPNVKRKQPNPSMPTSQQRYMAEPIVAKPKAKTH